MWVARDSSEVVASGKVAEDDFMGILVCHTSEAYMCNKLTSLTIWAVGAEDVWYLSGKEEVD